MGDPALAFTSGWIDHQRFQKNVGPVRPAKRNMSPGTLTSPPITEVVCGFAFEPMPELDPVVLGIYWSQRKDEYPGRQLHQALTRPILLDPPFPLRVWLVGADDAFVLQIQSDRFYFNWRKRDTQYPRFSDQEEGRPGILTRALEELERFRSFCGKALGVAPDIQTIELTKIDRLVEKEHWRDLPDLARLVPWLEPFVRLSESPDPALALRFREARSRGTLLISITAMRDEQEPACVVQTERRLSNVEVRDLRADFTWANAQLDEVFAMMIPDTARQQHLGEE